MCEHGAGRAPGGLLRRLRMPGPSDRHAPVMVAAMGLLRSAGRRAHSGGQEHAGQPEQSTQPVPAAGTRPVPGGLRVVIAPLAAGQQPCRARSRPYCGACGR